MSGATQTQLLDLADQLIVARRRLSVLTLALHSADLDAVEGGLAAIRSCAVDVLGTVGLVEEDIRALIAT